MSRKFGDRKSIDLAGVGTWPTTTLSTPRGQLEAWLVPIAWQRGTAWYGPHLFAVEDDREPGTVWTCQAWGFSAYKGEVEQCVATLEAVLEDPSPEPGLVR